jgi:hypothetical protein
MHPTHEQVSAPADTTTPGTGDTSATPARVLRDAASYLSRHGWVQGSYYDQTATVFTPAACLVGAIGMVCYGGPVDAPALHHDAPGWSDFDSAVSYLDEELTDEYGMDVYTWNDTPGRNAADVIATLYEMADLCGIETSIRAVYTGGSTEPFGGAR